MIVRDINGEKLRLTNVRLTEIVGEAIPEQPWYALLADIALSADKGRSLITIRMHEKFVVTDAHRHSALAIFDYDAWANSKKRRGLRLGFGYDGYYSYRIGCRHFDKQTFDFIVAVARASAARYR